MAKLLLETGDVLLLETSDALLLDDTYTAPGAPSAVTGTALSSTKIDLSWTAPVDNGGSAVTGYKIERNGGAGWSTLVADTASTGTTYSDTGLTVGTQYYYRVSAINAIGTGSLTSTGRADTNSSLAGPINCFDDELDLDDWDFIDPGAEGDGGASIPYSHGISGGKLSVTIGAAGAYDTGFWAVPRGVAVPFAGKGVLLNIGAQDASFGGLDNYSTSILDAIQFSIGAAGMGVASFVGAHVGIEFLVDDGGFLFDDPGTLYVQIYIGGVGTGALAYDWTTGEFWIHNTSARDWAVCFKPSGGDWSEIASGESDSDVGSELAWLGFYKALSDDDVTTTFQVAGINCGTPPTEGTGCNPLGLLSVTAAFSGIASGHALALTDDSVPEGDSTIVSWEWDFNTGDQTSGAQNPTFVDPADGTYPVSLTVTNSEGETDTATGSFTFGAGSSLPPYDLPTTKVAGRFLIKLDSTVDFTGVDGMVEDTDGGQWLNYIYFPIPSGLRVSLLRSVEITDDPDQPVRTLRATLVLDGPQGSISTGAVDSWANNRSGAFSPVLFPGRQIIAQHPLAAETSTDPDNWRPRFHGYIDDALASLDGLTVEIFARDIAQRLQIPYRP
jgi:hypothetical protein